ncbi:MAG: ribosomal RNA small subunit methyltransferase A [Mycoplasmataceae bacterium]|nr:ribosomal RNA small subunit methyltransferase A [Mycoplasmataceae bacterium]
MNKNYALKRFGQNFLQDETVLKKIASTLDLKGKNIIEIGPGKGALSKLILQEAKQLVAFEIDYNLCDFLKLEIKNNNFILINEDFLKADLSKYKGYSIMANIPYNITTSILFKIFENNQNFDEIILMVQKEVAERISAIPGSTNYGKLTVSSSHFAEVKKLFDISPKAFFPSPKVTSSIIHIKIKKVKPIIDDTEFLSFVKFCFAMRRKTLINNLKVQKNFDEQKITHFYLENNLNKDVRPQILTLNQYYELFKCFS